MSRYILLTLMLTISSVALANNDVIVIPYEATEVKVSDVRVIEFKGQEKVEVRGENSNILYGVEKRSIRAISFFNNQNLVSVDEKHNDSPYQIYPNPTFGVTILFGLNKGNIVSIYSQQGQLLYHFTAVSEQQMIDISAFPVGVYFVNVNEQFTTKMIKK